MCACTDSSVVWCHVCSMRWFRMGWCYLLFIWDLQGPEPMVLSVLVIAVCIVLLKSSDCFSSFHSLRIAGLCTYFHSGFLLVNIFKKQSTSLSPMIGMNSCFTSLNKSSVLCFPSREAMTRPSSRRADPEAGMADLPSILFLSRPLQRLQIRR